MERATGIEPVSLAWKAKVLPLHNARSNIRCIFHLTIMVKKRLRKVFNRGRKSGLNRSNSIRATIMSAARGFAAVRRQSFMTCFSWSGRILDRTALDALSAGLFAGGE